METVSGLLLIIIISIVVFNLGIRLAYKNNNLNIIKMSRESKAVKNSNIFKMNRVSKWIAIALAVFVVVFIGFKEFNKEIRPYTFEDLRMHYKNYVIVDKYVVRHDTYYFKLKNPCDGTVKKVPVIWSLYHYDYHVKDIIR